MKLVDKYKNYSPVVLRIGISMVFLWFGITQIINPNSFLGYVPGWIFPHPLQMIHEHPFQLVHDFPITPHLLIMGNGIFETIFGTMLILGIFTRIASFLLGLHLLGIMVSLGYNDIAVRDFGLALSTFAIFLHGPDNWCFDKKLRKVKKRKQK